MQDWVVGLLAIAVGALFCFRGFMTMRIVIPVWGAFTGFFLGAGLISAITDDGFLRSALAWVVAIIGAVAQFRQADRMSAPMRQTRADAGGREFRAA